MMRAARFHQPHAPLALEDVEPPPLGADEVRVRVRAAGLCRTELHFVEGLYAPAKTPMILGHEVAGEVAECGADVAAWAEGERVAVNYYLFCGRCRWCLRGEHNLCLELRGLFAFVSDGGFAEYVTVPAHCLVALPESVSFEQGAPLCCSSTTAIHASRRGAVAAGEVVVVIGAGGVGLSAIQVARLSLARVIAVDVAAESRRSALAQGAELAVGPDEAEAAVQDLAGGEGADVVLEFVGSAQSMPLAVRLLGRRGRLVFVGYTGDPLELSPLDLIVPEQTITTSVGHTHADLELAADLAGRGLIETVVTGVRPLGEVNDAIAELQGGHTGGRIVLTP